MSTKLSVKKRFLINDIPEGLDIIENHETHISYLATGLSEVKVIRKISDRYDEKFMLIVKNYIGRSIKESSVDIPSHVYSDLLMRNSLRPIIGKELKVNVNGKVARIFYYVDVELDWSMYIELALTEQDLESFVNPDWFGEEVTGNTDGEIYKLWYEKNPR